MKTVDIKVVGGFQFTIWVSENHLPFMRASKYMELQDNAHWHVGPATVDIYHKNLKEAIQNNKNDDALRLIGYMDQLRAMETTFSQVLEYVNVFIMMPGEDPHTPTSEWLEKKKLISKNPEIMTFFLTSVQIYLKHIKDTQKDIVAFLMDHQRARVEKRLLFLIGRPVLLTFNKV